MRRLAVGLAAALALLAAAPVWADNCSDLRSRVARLDKESSTLPGYLDLRVVLSSLYSRLCHRTAAAPAESWYDIDGKNVGPATGARPPNGAYTATDEVAKACADSSDPSMCAMIRGSVAMCGDPPEGEVKRACVVAGGYPDRLTEDSNAPPLPPIAITLAGRRYEVPAACADKLANIGEDSPGEHTVLRNRMRGEMFVDALKSDCPADFVDALAARMGTSPDDHSLIDALPALRRLVAGGFGLPGAGGAGPARSAWADPGFQEMCLQARGNRDTCVRRQINMGPVDNDRAVRGRGQNAAFADCAALYGSVARMCNLTEARATQPPPPPLPVVAKPAPPPAKPTNGSGKSAPPPKAQPQPQQPQMSAQCQKLVGDYVAAAQANDGPRALAGYNALKGAGGCGVLARVDRPMPQPQAAPAEDPRFIARGATPLSDQVVGGCDASPAECQRRVQQLRAGVSPEAQAALFMNAVSIGLQLGATMAQGMAGTMPQGGGTNTNSIGNRPVQHTYGQGAPVYRPQPRSAPSDITGTK